MHKGFYAKRYGSLWIGSEGSNGWHREGRLAAGFMAGAGLDWGFGAICFILLDDFFWPVLAPP